MFICKKCLNKEFSSLKFFYVCKKCNKTYSEDEIKSSIDLLFDEKVSVISKEMFKYRELNFVKIPKSVIKIEESAFEGCANLLNVFLDEDSDLKIIEDNAFFNCSKLENVDIPKSINSIGFNVFGNTKIVHDYIEYKGAKYIGTKENRFLMLFESLYSSKEIEIHKDTKFILNSAFVDDLKIQKLIINENLIEIGEYAFDGCINLKEIIKVKNKQKINIKDCAFINCMSLKNTL